MPKQHIKGEARCDFDCFVCKYNDCIVAYNKIIHSEAVLKRDRDKDYVLQNPSYKAAVLYKEIVEGK